MATPTLYPSERTRHSSHSPTRPDRGGQGGQGGITRPRTSGSPAGQRQGQGQGQGVVRPRTSGFPSSHRHPSNSYMYADDDDMSHLSIWALEKVIRPAGPGLSLCQPDMSQSRDMESRDLTAAQDPQQVIQEGWDGVEPSARYGLASPSSEGPGARNNANVPGSGPGFSGTFPMLQY
ncbi:hypothetical protein B484DRAFT_408357 [Ochromonadaceae sp. CCMP2298]|nr:hypothetical protein B484DRAFT_408357 [Ochromonadaceae sp. CCMP2298]